jgi:hypothetical protein
MEFSDGRDLCPAATFQTGAPTERRLLIIAREAKERAATLPPGPERQELLKQAREAKLAAELEDWLSSPGLQPPK